MSNHYNNNNSNSNSNSNYQGNPYYHQQGNPYANDDPSYQQQNYQNQHYYYHQQQQQVNYQAYQYNPYTNHHHNQYSNQYPNQLPPNPHAQLPPFPHHHRQQQQQRQQYQHQQQYQRQVQSSQHDRYRPPAKRSLSTSPADTRSPPQPPKTIASGFIDEETLGTMYDFDSAQNEKWFSNPKSFVGNLFLGSKVPYERTKIPSASGGFWARCSLQIPLSDTESITIVGAGNSEKIAEKNCALHVCLKLWNDGLMAMAKQYALSKTKQPSNNQIQEPEELLFWEDGPNATAKLNASPKQLGELKKKVQDLSQLISGCFPELKFHTNVIPGQRIPIGYNNRGRGRGGRGQRMKYQQQRSVTVHVAELSLDIPIQELPAEALPKEPGTEQVVARLVGTGSSEGKKPEAEYLAYSNFLKELETYFPPEKQAILKEVADLEREEVILSKRFVKYWYERVFVREQGSKSGVPQGIKPKVDCAVRQIGQGMFNASVCVEALDSSKKKMLSCVDGKSRKLAEDKAWIASRIACMERSPHVWNTFLQSGAAKTSKGAFHPKFVPDDRVESSESIGSQGPAARLFGSDGFGNGSRVVLPVGLTEDQITEMKSFAEKLEQHDAFFYDSAWEEDGQSSTSKAPNMVSSSSGRGKLDASYMSARNMQLERSFQHYQNDKSTEKIRHVRWNLPVYKYREEVLQKIEHSDVLVIIGATGSGKTTQIPQIILEDAISKNQGAQTNIIVTQPRRLAAISVANRIAQERNERLGDSVGYQVRFESVFPKRGGSILFCTTGVLLRRLTGAETRYNEGATEGSDQDRWLEEVTHLIIDEVHERDLNTDFFVTIMKKVWRRRREKYLQNPQTELKPFKLILMSATLNTELFVKYFKDPVAGIECPKVDIPGRTFPVEQFYLQDVVKLLQPVWNMFQGLGSSETHRYLDREMNIANELARLRQSISAQGGSSKISYQDEKADGDEELEEEEEYENPWEEAELALREAKLLQEGADEIPYEVIFALLAHIVETTVDTGSILIFLPGWDEISKLYQFLTDASHPLVSRFGFADTSKFAIFKLHSSVPVHTQEDVFKPLSARKIILSTNIAETSITIEDVVYVIDSGKVKEKHYDPSRKVTMLETRFTSQASSKQRMGRAGRVRKGQYYSLISQERFKLLAKQQVPEMLRSDLAEICLHIKALEGQGGHSNGAHSSFDNHHRAMYHEKSSIVEVLENAPNPPSSNSIFNSIDHLKRIGAFDRYESLTSLGRMLALLPVEPGLGKMILLGVVFKCLDPILTLAASVTSPPPFITRAELRSEVDKQRLQFTYGERSDHLVVINLWNEWCKIRQDVTNQQSSTYRPPRFRDADDFSHPTLYKWLDDRYISRSGIAVLEKTRKHLFHLLVKSGFVEEVAKMERMRGKFIPRPAVTDLLGGPELNVNADNTPLIRSLLCVGVSPNLALRLGKDVFRANTDWKVYMHPSSLNYRRNEETFMSSDYKRVLLNPSVCQETADFDGANFVHVNNPHLNAKQLGTLFCFSEKWQSKGRILLRGTTRVNPFEAALFAKIQNLSSVTGYRPLAILDTWLQFGGAPDDVNADVVLNTLDRFKKYLDKWVLFYFENWKTRVGHEPHQHRVPTEKKSGKEKDEDEDEEGILSGDDDDAEGLGSVEAGQIVTAGLSRLEKLKSDWELGEELVQTLAHLLKIQYGTCRVE